MSSETAEATDGQRSDELDERMDEGHGGEDDGKDEDDAAGDSDLDSDSSSPDAAQSARLAEQVAAFERTLSRDPFHYDSHVKLIALLQSDGDDLDRLRGARERMAKLYPLTPRLWLDWIRSEADLCLDDDEKLRVLDLFRRAVVDYTSAELWLEYCQFSIGLMGGPGGVDRVRAVFEEACNKVGLHVMQGALVYEAYREFEMIMYSNVQAASAAATTAGGDEKASKNPAEEVEKQRQKIYSLFRRQLAVPLLGMDKTLEEFKEFNGGSPDETLMMLYNKAFQKLQAILPFEDKLTKDGGDGPKAGDYEPYLDAELKEGDAARIQMLFERAILDDCLNAELWDKYLKYLDFTLKIDSLALPVHERSVRNCSWASSLWVSYLTCLEKLHSTPAKIQSVVDEAFQVGFATGADNLAIWMFHISWLRRQVDMKQPQEDLVAKLRNCFQKAQEHLQQFSAQQEGTDCVSPILQFWAKLEAKLGNLPRAREIWNLITRQGAASDAQTWLDYATFERTFGDDKHYRKVLQRGMYASVDWPETFAQLWIQFELEEGTLEGLMEAQAKFEARMRIVNEKRQKAAERQALHEAENDHQGHHGGNDDSSSKTPVGKAKKRKVNRAEGPKLSPEVEKKGKWQDLDSDGFKMPQPVGSAAQNNKNGGPQDEAKEHGVGPTDHDPLKDAQTVFLSNLAYEVEESKILEAFADVGPIEELRLVRDYKKRCKGFGYLVFRDIHSVERAIKTKDRAPVDGRPVFVSRINERKGFAYRQGLEKNKLFVKNIPFDATKEEMQSLFGQCGEVTDVRMSTLRTGKFKGMAYVDFLDEASASAAVVKFDGFELRDKALAVSISNPPARNPAAGDSKSHHNHGDRPGPTGASQQQAAKGSTMKHRMFVPRSLQVKPSTAAATTSATTELPKPRSNDDFRNMLLNNKSL